MANSAKNKGDRFELAAVAFLMTEVPELVSVNKAQRLLGAGRKEDVGDIHVFNDVAIQVRALANLGQAIRSSASDSVIQAGNEFLPHALGMVPVPRARKEQVNWLACVDPDHWPVPVEPVAEFKIVSKALDWVWADEAPYGFRAWPREERIGLLAGLGKPALVAPMAAWFTAYRAGLQAKAGLSAA